MAKLTYKKAEQALQATGGIVADAAKACGVSRRWFSRFMERHPELREVREGCFEELLDVAEGQLRTAISAGDMKSVRWMLETRGKDRGYTRREERSGPGGEPLQFEAIERHVVYPKPPKPEA